MSTVAPISGALARNSPYEADHRHRGMGHTASLEELDDVEQFLKDKLPALEDWSDEESEL